MQEPTAKDTGGDAAAEHPSAASARENVRSRFATPVESTQPVNADEQSDQPFAPPPAAEDKARSEKTS